MSASRVFDHIKPGARVRGLAPAGIAEVVQVSRFGADALNIVFRADGKVGERLLYRGEESAFEFVESGRVYAFDADGGLLRLASAWLCTSGRSAGDKQQAVEHVG